MLKSFLSSFKKHTLTGISYMIPVTVTGGICIGLARIFGGTTFVEGTFPYILNQIGGAAIGFTFAVIAAFIAFSIAGRPGIAPGLAIGSIAATVKSGFLGALIGGFLVGGVILLIKKYIKLPKGVQGLMPILIIPVLTTLTVGLFFFYGIGKPLALLQAALTNWLASMEGTSMGVLGAIIGGMRIDMGGPFAQAAALFSNMALAEGVYGPKAANIVSGMTPPLGVALAVFLNRKKFSAAEFEAAKAAVPMGLCYITEGVFPFLATDPIRIIIACTIGSAFAGGTVGLLGVESPVPHGGIFAVPFMVKPWGFILGLVVGTLVTAIVLLLLKPKQVADNEQEEKDLDFEISF